MAVDKYKRKKYCFWWLDNACHWWSCLWSFDYARGGLVGWLSLSPTSQAKGRIQGWVESNWNNHDMMLSWFHDITWRYHGILSWPCWFQNWLHQRSQISSNSCTCFGSTYTKIGTIQRRLAWPLRKDDTQNREAFHIFCTASSWYFFSMSKNSQIM